MNSRLLFPLGLCALLGACATVPPTEPHRVTAIAGEKVSDKNFARDDAACKANARSVTDAEAAANQGQSSVQAHFDHLYADCMGGKGYDIEEMRRHVGYYYGPGPYYYGPGPYWGPGFYYGGGWGRRW